MATVSPNISNACWTVGWRRGRVAVRVCAFHALSASIRPQDLYTLYALLAPLPLIPSVLRRHVLRVLSAK